MYLPRPIKPAGCPDNQCSVGPLDCFDKGRLSPRRNRTKVREQIKDAVLLELGAPTVEVELDEQALDYCVDFALKVIEDYAPREFFDYYVFNTTPGKSVYELPPDVGHVRNVFYRETPQFGFSATDLGGSIPIEYFYPGGALADGGSGGIINPVQPIWGQMGQWVQYQMYADMYSRVSSGLGGWEWVGGYRHIKLYPIPCRSQAVMVHYLQRCKDWDCITQAMIDGSTSKAKQILGRVRGKIKNIPGPNGGIQLDGDQLLQEGKEEWKEFEQRLIDRYGDIPYFFLG
jgi:hypothetical protein